MWHSVELRKLRQSTAVQPDESSLVAHLVAVVGSREHGDALAIVLHHIPSVLYLVRPHHQLQPVPRQERRRDVGAKGKPHPSLGRRFPWRWLGVYSERNAQPVITYNALSTLVHCNQ